MLGGDYCLNLPQFCISLNRDYVVLRRTVAVQRRTFKMSCLLGASRRSFFVMLFKLKVCCILYTQVLTGTMLYGYQSSVAQQAPLYVFLSLLRNSPRVYWPIYPLYDKLRV